MGLQGTEYVNHGRVNFIFNIFGLSWLYIHAIPIISLFWLIFMATCYIPWMKNSHVSWLDPNLWLFNTHFRGWIPIFPWIFPWYPYLQVNLHGCKFDMFAASIPMFKIWFLEIHVFIHFGGLNTGVVVLIDTYSCWTSPLFMFIELNPQFEWLCQVTMYSSLKFPSFCFVY